MASAKKSSRNRSNTKSKATKKKNHKSIDGTCVDVSSLEKLEALAKKMSAQVKAGSIFLLEGPLGAGKTQWVRYFTQFLGGDGVSSPTFTFHQPYPTKDLIVHHFDFYRIQSTDDLESTGFWDIFQDKNSVVVVEWASRLPSGILPTHWQVIHMLFSIQDDQREVEVRYKVKS